MHDQRYPLTTTILADRRLKALFCRVVVHEEEDQSDCLWLEYTPEDALSEGEYIAIDQNGDGCTLWHDLAHNVGGHATVWDFRGTESEALNALANYLQTTRFAG